jgi:hypothetical protein
MTPISMPIDAWQARLEQHFAGLAAARSGLPLFALEHSLERHELDTVASLLRLRIRNGMPLDPHWLLWVVYAAELGYDYKGDEYWRSFESGTGGWRALEHRPTLRRFFSRFAQTYNGVTPTGQWAAWFTIIAWPVTHAILPRYLQRQLLQLLYASRYDFAGLNRVDAAAVGRLLASKGLNAPSRLQEFLQQTELVGRIVVALTSDGENDAQTLIHPPTLSRIIADLTREQSARAWLSATRGVLADRFKSVGRYARSATSTQDERERPALELRPRLMLRPSTNKIWSTLVAFPSFAPLAALNTEFRDFLSMARCKVEGAADTWLSPGWLLHSSQTRALKSWPHTDQPLLRFERPNAALEHLTTGECRLGSLPLLCRIAPDGLAHEIRGRHVRPDKRYILLTPQPVAHMSAMLQPCAIDCADIHATFLNVPKLLSPADEAILRQLGLQPARTVELWPAGLPSRAWNDEDESEWLTTESPCFAILPDHAVDSYRLALNNGIPTTILSGSAGLPAFIRLKPLPSGKHVLSISARSKTASGNALGTEGSFTLLVREPKSWIPGTTSYGGLLVTLEPHEPTFDELWQGDARISIAGPEGCRIDLHLALEQPDGTQLVCEKFPLLRLPVSADGTANLIASFVKKYAWKNFEASCARLTISGDEFGDYVVRCERQLKPLRWACNFTAREAALRIINDTGSAASPKASLYPFRNPTQPAPLDSAQASAGFPPAAGGLYVCELPPHRDAVIITAARTTGDLRQLLISPDDESQFRGHAGAGELVSALALWKDARAAGPLAESQRAHIVVWLSHHLVKTLCGADWLAHEIAYLSRTRSDADREFLGHCVGNHSFAAALRLNAPAKIAEKSIDGRWLAEVASRHSVPAGQELADFALCLAAEPHRLPPLYHQDLQSLLTQAAFCPVILRGARFLSLLKSTSSEPDRDR